MSVKLGLSDTREFSDASEESGLDDSKLNTSFCTSPDLLQGLSGGHFSPCELSLENTPHDYNVSNSENISSIMSPPSGLFSINSISSSESPHLNYETQASVVRLKKVLADLNDARVRWLESEFMMKCCLDSMEKLPKEISTKMKDVIVNSKVKQLPKLKSESGETFSILGLDEDNLENMGDSESIANHSSIAVNNFSQLEKNAIKRAVRNVAKSEIEKYSGWKSERQGQLLSHCERVVGQSGLMSEDRERLNELYRVVPEKLAQVVDQLTTINQLMQQLAQPDMSEQELLGKTYALVRDRAECLHKLNSYLKLKMDSQILLDRKNVKSINEEGDKLKADLAEGAKELKSLQNKLEQFKALENLSPEFKEIVAEYTKIKKILQHKRQALEMCYEHNTSLS